MITRILIDKSPAFSHIKLDLHKGFNVISGVSGSGKSVFLHAMLSAFGLKESHAALVEINLTLRLKEIGICLEDFGIAGDLDTDDFDIKDSNVKDSVIQADSNKQIESKTNKDSKMPQVSSTNEDSALQTDINVQIDSNVKDLVAQTESKTQRDATANKDLSSQADSNQQRVSAIQADNDIQTDSAIQTESKTNKNPNKQKDSKISNNSKISKESATQQDSILQTDIHMQIDSTKQKTPSNNLVISVLKKQNTRYFINNQAISKKKLSEIAHHFIKYISIKDGNELENDYMLHILDSITMQKDSKFNEILQEYNQTFIEHKQCKIKLQELEEMQRNIENLKDFAQFEIDKITKAQPQIGEYEKLMSDKKLLSKKEKVMETCNKALLELDSLDSIYKAFELLNIDNASFLSHIMEARGHIENGLDEFNSLDIDIESLLERISLLADIIRRYGSEEDALKHLAMQQQKLQEYESIEFDKTKIEEKFLNLTKRLENLANTLHEKRKDCLPIFVEKLNYYAKELRLDSVSIDQNKIECYQYGLDSLQIYLASKQKSVLSSGEYNRMRLAMLCVAASYNTYSEGILILDEIDANLSGEESEGVAKLLQFLSKHYQVFAISHQPFMPLLCDRHYLVSKESESTSTIKLLNKKERIKEVARMISGSKLDKHALSYAEKLLQQQQNSY
ncbi:MAG: hypothetical protein SPJ83_04120 [Helicobacter sp.]|uniref:hypothetical protein n=1 Tax=Helicobacter sp. TaxID=218 RepID=UPI002A910821|nr:hypothetical protein [Helicobacter sp.]MDY5821971.1 hypothetical protein [Helicobacter sp.]